jgi:hypothetical protein
VVATHDLHIGLERRDFSRTLHRRDQVAHHQLTVGQCIVLRPVHGADVVLEVLCALRQVGEVGGLTQALGAIVGTARHGDQDILLCPIALAEDLPQLGEIDLELAS